jgi:PAS domain S-box-containing protein
MPKDSTEMFKRLLDAMTDGVMFQDHAGKITAVNPSIGEILGLPTDEIVGKDVTQLQCTFIREDGTVISEHDHPVMVALHTGNPIRNCILGITEASSSVTKWISISVVPMPGTCESDTASALTLVRDVSSEYKLKRHMTESQLHFKAFLDNLDEGAWYRDFQSGELLFVNDALANMFGIDKSDLFEEDVNRYIDFIHSDDRVAVVSGQNHHLSTGEPVAMNWKLVRADHSVRHVSLRLFCFTVPGTDNKTYSAGLMTDLTDQYLRMTDSDFQRERAEELNRLKTNLLSTISHEFRTPITGIVGFAKLLQDDIKEKDRIEFARHIEKSTVRLYKTLESILDYSVLDAKKVDLRPVRLSIQESTRMVAERYNTLTAEKGLYFQCQFSGEDQVYFYRNILDTILTHVLDNAIKFTTEGGIRLLFNVVHEAMHIEVHDTGSGIPPEYIPYIFEPFRQGSEGIGRLYDGVGMGLAIVKKYVETAGGTIELKKNEHGGSSFIIRIPLPELPETHNDMNASNHQSGRSRLLYVEDNQIMQLLVKSMLKSINIDFVKTAGAAIQKTSAHRYDVILLDINLNADTDGISLLNEIRSIEGYEHVPVVVITAYSLNELTDRNLNLHQVEYISKPFSERQLKTILKPFIPELT